jgi:hypothetical protein
LPGHGGDDYKAFVNYSSFPSSSGISYGASASFNSKNFMSTSKAPECSRPVWKSGSQVINFHGKRIDISGLVIYLVDFSEKKLQATF